MRRRPAQRGPADQRGALLDRGRPGAERVGRPAARSPGRRRPGWSRRPAGSSAQLGRPAPPRTASASSVRNVDGPRGLTAVVPPVPGGQQQVPGPGQRHVEQPALLAEPARSSQRLAKCRRRRRRARLRSPPAWHVEAGQVGARRRAAGRQLGAAGQPARPAIGCRPGNTSAIRCGTATTSHSRPLAACTVSTCTRSASTSTSPGLEPVLGVLGGVQVVEQRGQGRHLGARREVGHDVGERVEVGAAGGAVPVRRGGHLDVEQQHPLGVGDQVGQRLRAVRGRSAASSAASAADPAVAVGGVALAAGRGRRARRPGWPARRARRQRARVAGRRPSWRRPARRPAAGPGGQSAARSAGRRAASGRR